MRLPIAAAVAVAGIVTLGSVTLLSDGSTTAAATSGALLFGSSVAMTASAASPGGAGAAAKETVVFALGDGADGSAPSAALAN